jgi:ketosteroid isomerase-like protein
MEPNMSTQLILELVHTYFAAFVTGDRRGIEALLTPDFTFTSPSEDLIDRATYIERCWALAGTFEYHDLRSTFVANDECVVLYESKSTSGNVQRNVELLRFRGNRLASVEVFMGRPPYLFTDVRWARPGLPMALTPSGV